MAITGSGTDTVNGNGGNDDVLTGLASGASTITDSGTDDTFNVTSTADVITGDSTGLVDSTVSWNLGSTRSTGVDDLTLTGNVKALTATGNSSSDVLIDATTGAGATGGNHLVGNSADGDDTFTITHAGDVVSEAHASSGVGHTAVLNSSISITALGANIEDLNLTGATNLVGTGNSLVNDITGSTGTDTLSDGDSANSSATGDTLVGNSATGADTFIVNDSNDVVTETHIKVGSAVSLVESTASFTLGANMEALTLSGTASITGTGNSVADILKSSTTGTDALLGNGGADTFYLNHAGDTAAESNGAGGAVVNSTISYALGANMSALALSGISALTGTGNTSADVLTSNTGKDTLVGNSTAGADTFVVNNIGDSITEVHTSTAAVVDSSVTWNLGSTFSTGVDNLTFTGTSVVTGTGTTTGGIFTSNTAADTLIGKATTGSDTFIVNNAGDHVSETGTGTADLVIAKVGSFTLGANIENLTLSGTGNLVGTGNTLANVITATGTGTDTLSDGGAGGADTITGNSALGNDTFLVNNAGDHVTENNASAGATDIALVKSTASFTLGANMEALTLSGSTNLVGTGNTLANVLTSNTGVDTLTGNSATGGDTFIVSNAGDHVSEAGASNTGDLIVFNSTTASAAFSLAGTNVDKLTLSGTAALSGTGNSDADILTSNTGKDTLTGNSALGNDTFYVSNAGDSVVETNASGGAGDNAAVISSVSWTLGAHLESLTLTGTGTGTGNTSADTLTSSSTGVDKLIGKSATGGDTFFVNHASDTVSESGTSNAGDLIVSNSTFSLATVGGLGVNSLLLTGTANLTGTGNTGANLITGNTGTDLLSDGGNATNVGDTLIGNSAHGTDSFIVNSTVDVVSETNAGTTALITSDVSWNLGGTYSTNVNNLTLTGAGHGLTATGNTSADVITDATATTATGNNTLIGNSTTGHDTFVISHTGDTVVENGSTVGEVIMSTISQTLTGNNTGDITLSGTAALTAYGNTGADILTSSATGGKDTLIGNTVSGGDTFFVNNAADVVKENGAGVTGNLVSSTVNFNLATNNTGTGQIDNLTFTGTAALTGAGNTVAGILTTNTGKDIMVGHDSNSATNDTFVVNNATDTISEAGASQHDVVDSTVSWTLGAATAFTSLTLTGAGHALKAVGNAATGGDIITDATMGSGANTLIGNGTSGNNDTFVVGAAGDLISEHGAASADSVFASVNFTLGTSASFANLTLTGTSNLTGIGNNGANVITGNTGTDVLTDGGDTVGGLSGDTLIGNSTADNDTFMVSNIHDHVSEASAGAALIDSSVSLDLGTNVTNVNRLDLTAATITATGNTSNDTLTDGGAADTLIGNSSAGADTFILTHAGDAVSEANTGASLIESSVSFNLATGNSGGNTGVNQLTLISGATGQTATGNASNDTITDNDTVVGSGHNILNDGNAGGHDTLVDLAGNDTFVVNSLLDSVTETIAGSTSAAVDSSVNYTLGANINSLTLSGGATSGAGNSAGGDTVTGNTNADVLSDNGATTADHLIGHSSSGDTFLVSNIADIVSEAGTGSGSIINVDKSGSSGLAFSLVGTGATELEFTVGTGADTLTAAATGNDTLIGSTGSNIFNDGGASTVVGFKDSLEGNSSAGTDTFYVNNTGDLVTEAGTATAALINTTVGFNLDTGATGGGTTNVNELTLSGTTATGVSLTGNALNDTITDSSTLGLNVLADGTTGGSAASYGGHDTMVDSSTHGGDTFVVNSVFDSITEGSAVHQGTVISSVNYTLGTNLDVLTLDGATANAATGNAAGGDTITGNTISTVISDNHAAGPSGADSMIGNDTTSGSDTFVVYDAYDHVTEAALGSGLVQLQSGSTAESFSLTGTGVHQLTMYGTGADSGTGTGGGDTIIGNTGDDMLSDGGAGAGSDSLQGNSSTGGDTFVVNNLTDTINEAANIGGDKDGIVTSLANGVFDSLTNHGGSQDFSGFNNLTLTGSTASTAVGNNLANLITGNTGDDTIISGTGTDTLVGHSAGTGDTFEVNNANDHVTEVGTNTDALITSSVNFNLGTGGDGSHTTNVNELTLTAGNLTGTGNIGSDVLTGNSTGDVLVTTAGAGANTIIAGTGLETFIINNATDTITESHATTGSVVEAYADFTLGANLTTLTLETGATTGTGNGTGGDTITGNTSNDFLSDGGSAASGDSLIGNSTAGDDTFLISNASDTITETNTIGAGATIESTISYALGSTYANLELVNGATGKTATGDSVNDTITDNDTAGGGNILTDGNAGGHDTMIDNAGNDTFVVSYAGDSVTEAHASTTSLVESSISFTLGANLNNLHLEGASNITGTGNAAGGNVITGNDGNDVLSDNSGIAADTLIGHSSAGHDTFIVNNTADLVSEAGTANGNMLETQGTYSIASIAGIEKVTLQGTGTLQTITGNGENDTLTDATTTATHNILVSGAGTDSFVDSNANSTGDTFYANSAADTFSETHGAGSVIWGSGLNVTYTLGTDITNVTLLGGAGTDSITANSAGSDTITAGTGSGTEIFTDGLAGAGGNDSFIAGAGTHDTFIMNNAGDTVQGNNTGWSGDVIDYYVTGHTYTLGANINNLVIESNGSGGNDNDTIYANTGNDSISANTHSNTFFDGGGYDTLTGIVSSTGGADTFSGGGGFDVFTISNSNDVIDEANPGQYLINSYASFTLTTNLGNLTLLGEQNLTGTATTAGGAVIVGNFGSDILSDGGDATVGVGDTLIGNSTVVGAGNGDTFIVSNTADTVSEAGTGIGTVEASVSYTLGLGTTHLLMTGTSNVSATGNATAGQADVLVGNSHNDVLSDGGNDTAAPDNSVVGHNADTMIGHSGLAGDTFMVYNASDSITELGGATGSVIDTYVNHTLVSNVNTGNIEGNETGITLTGNSAVDTLTDHGTSTVGGNVLVSGTGADALSDESTTGSDTFYVSNTNDTVNEKNGTGFVYSSVSFDLGTVTSDGAGSVKTLNLTGSGTDTATAAAGGHDTITATTIAGTDVLIGTGGNDLLVGSTTAGVHTTFVVNLASDSITASAANAVNNTIETSSATFDNLGAGADSHVNNLILTAISMTGTASGTASNSITGQGGSDTMSDTAADAHADTLTGTGGSDVFNVHNVSDVVTETGASATVNADVSFTMGANINVLNLAGASLEGTANNGTDTITSAGNSDTLVGGTGADSLSGSGTGDVYYVNGAGTTVAEAGSGAIVHADVSFALGANMTTLILSGDINLSGTGFTSGSDSIVGNSGDDVLSNGTGGNATMAGNAIDGGDTFDVSNASDVVSELNGGGTALVNASFSASTFTLGTHIDNITLAATFGTDTLIGNNSSDNITMIDNGTGGDVLNANGTGADTLTDHSSAGGDTFDVNNALDIVSEDNGTTGVVLYKASGADSFTLSTHITTLDANYATATGNDTFIGGGSGGDSISGSWGSDVISDAGGTGGDTITGHTTAGIDTFLVTNASDVITEAGAGTGIIKVTNHDWSLATNTTNVTTLEISGSGHTATGITTAAVTLEDLSGGNTLSVGGGSAHNDTLIGGADTMNLSLSAHDIVQFSAADAYNGVATINNFATGSTLDIDNIISGGHPDAATSYQLVVSGSDTKLMVDYDIHNVSYSYIEIALIKNDNTMTGADIT